MQDCMLCSECVIFVNAQNHLMFLTQPWISFGIYSSVATIAN